MNTTSKYGTEFFHFNLVKVVIPISVFILMISDVVVALEDDIRCLKGIKASFRDSKGIFESWDLDNSSMGSSFCKFHLVECWSTRLIGIKLPSSELTGQIPDSLRYCANLQNLDLSNNKVSGIIPPQICTWLPYLVYLDLSGNNISGEIPRGLANCTYLNGLDLSSNHLSGQIPYGLSRLDRLRDFSVANNDLSGQIPLFKSNMSTAAFEGNNGLCGAPLGIYCTYEYRKQQPVTSKLLFYGGVALGFIVGFWGLFFILLIKKEKWWFSYWKLVDNIATRITKPLL